MAWLLLLLVPFVGLPVLRMALFPARRGPAIPWSALGIGAVLLIALWMNFGPGKSEPDTVAAYQQGDSALRALLD